MDHDIEDCPELDQGRVCSECLRSYYLLEQIRIYYVFKSYQTTLLEQRKREQRIQALLNDELHDNEDYN